ncbi:MAG TPA: hypothetical protein VF832_05735, partial [Longimicrobiales bacterium]
GLPPLVLGLPFQRQQLGYPIGSFFSQRIVSATVDPTTGATSNVLCDDGKGGTVPCGSAAPSLFLGTPTPTYTGSVGNSVTLGRRLRLFAMVDFRGGNKLLDTDALIRCAIFGLCDVNVHPQNYDPTYVAATQRASTLQYVTAFVHDASFAKLRELSASYTLPERWAGRAGAHSAVLNLAARNLHTFTSYPGLDPERRSALYDQNQFYAFDQAVMPPPAEVVATLTFTF